MNITPALLILIGILFEMFTVEGTRLSFINKKTILNVLVTIVETTAMYILFLTLGWLVGKYFFKGFNLLPVKYLLGLMIMLLIAHAVIRERRKIPASGLLYQNQLLYLGIVLANSIIHLLSGIIFYKTFQAIEWRTYLYFNWILMGTVLFSLISVVLTYPRMRLFGFTIGKLKIALYTAALLIILFFTK